MQRGILVATESDIRVSAYNVTSAADMKKDLSSLPQTEHTKTGRKFLTMTRHLRLLVLNRVLHRADTVVRGQAKATA